jgi:hypothetical protein
VKLLKTGIDSKALHDAHMKSFIKDLRTSGIGGGYVSIFPNIR